MKQPKEKIDYHEHDDLPELYPDISDVASANECTGLMYRTPVSGEEWESYQQLSAMGIPREELHGTLSEKLRRVDTAERTGKAVEEAAGIYAPNPPDEKE